MKHLVLFLKILMALLLVSGGFNHFYQPEFYNSMIPDFLPKIIVNYISGIVEILLGIGLFIKGYEKKSAYGVFLLMIIFVPIHIWDYTKETPMIGSKLNAIIRLLMQVLFIAWAWFLYKKEN